jgi:phosphoglycolate phosphatase-like HAD superfamily hydrolase
MRARHPRQEAPKRRARLGAVERILLFDIDGTLLSMGGAARVAFTQALSEAAGRPVRSEGASFVGKTDPQIARELLTRHGVDGDELEPAIGETIRLYLGYFERDLPAAREARLLPGVAALLDALADRPGLRTALLTGNVEAGARLKLGHFGIADRFDFDLSAFGSDHADRYRLPAIALERARRRLDPGFDGRSLVIIGDSEHDVLCGRSVGARSVAVATGWTPADVLRALAPDHLLEDFSDTEAVLAALAGGAA